MTPQGHSSGSARTEGYYKMDSKLKAKYKYHHGRGVAPAAAADPHAHEKQAAKIQSNSREARSNQRRLLTAFGKCTLQSVAGLAEPSCDGRKTLVLNTRQETRQQ